MLQVHAVNERLSFPTDRLTVRRGVRYELFMVRQPRFGTSWFTGILFFLVLVFVVYSTVSGISNLWIYATTAAVLTFLLFCLALYFSFRQVYDRVFLLSSFGQALACQNCLLVVRDERQQLRAWFAAGATVFKTGKENDEPRLEMYVAGKLTKIDAYHLALKPTKRERATVFATRRRSFIQSDSVDLRDHLRASLRVDLSMLVSKAGLSEKSARRPVRG